MYCLRCKVKLKCVDSRTLVDDTLTIRRYKCLKCGLLTYTEETPIDKKEGSREMLHIKDCNMIKQMIKEQK